jgi:pimeloyl-ACP methyl ester carboxylesterase
MFSWDATGALATIPHPVLIISGDGDIVTKPEASGTMSRTAREPRLETLEDANHMSFLDHAPRYHALLGTYADEAFARAAAGADITP